MVVSDVVESDVCGIVKLHTMAFPDFFLTSLGDSFLEVYFTAVINSEYANCYKCVYEGAIVGYVFVVKKINGFNKSLVLKNILNFLGVAPKVSISNLLKVFLREFTSSNELNKTDDEKSGWHILSIATSVHYRDFGIGSRLIEHVVTVARDEGVKVISLTTDSLNNYKVRRFYTKHGFITSKEFTQVGDRKMLWMELSLNSNEVS